MKIDWVRRLFVNWPAKVLSLAVAVLLYFLTGINSLEERYITVQVDVQVPDGFTVYSRSFTRVPVTLRGNSDGIWAIGEEDVSLSADFLDIIDEGVFRSSLIIARGGQALRVDPLEIIPEQGEIEVEIQRIVERPVVVEPNIIGQPAVGYDLEAVSVSPAEISVAGPRSLVEALDSMLTDAIDVRDRSSSFTERVGVRLPDARLSLSETASVDIQVRIVERLTVATFSGVEIAVDGLDEHLLIDTFLFPGEVSVQGPQLLLEELNSGQIALTANASGVTGAGSFLLRVQPEVPRGLTVLGFEPQEVEIDFLERSVESLEDGGGETPAEDGTGGESANGAGNRGRLPGNVEQ